MLKFIALIPRREDVSRSFFRDYYESNHAPLALTFFRGFAKYLRNHVAAELDGEAPTFDVLSEFWYESMDELVKTGAFLESEQGPIIREDENQFMNQPGLLTLAVEETIWHGEPRCFEADVGKLALLAKCQAGQSNEQFLDAVKAHAEELVEQWGLSRLSCMAVQNGGQGSGEQAWDVLLFAWPREAGIQRKVPASLAKLFARFTLLETRSFETELQTTYKTIPAVKGATSEINV